MFIRGFEHHLDRTTDPHAKARGFGDNNFHVTTRSPSAAEQTATILSQNMGYLVAPGQDDSGAK
jgi:hypothetical protein